jgi:hypothetical protein
MPAAACADADIEVRAGLRRTPITTLHGGNIWVDGGQIVERNVIPWAGL